MNAYMKSKGDIWDMYVAAILQACMTPTNDSTQIIAYANVIGLMADAMMKERIERFGEVKEPVQPDEFMRKLMEEMKESLLPPELRQLAEKPQRPTKQ